MLGWMLKRGDNAADAANAANAGEDTTQADIPDTPAPVFAARAFKSALFGTPREEPRTRHTKASASTDQGARTPNSKPQGILLTPGTGANRPKRVSFGREVDDAAKINKDPLTSKEGGPHKRTRLNEALEKARQKKVTNVNKKAATTQQKKQLSDDEWEEEDDGEVDQDNYCSHDITLDLNEPHSQSGRFWKEEFEKYHKDAKAEMEKLLKYKQLAKSYAQQKDAEAIGLAEMLKDEQQKVIKMEKKIAQNASNIISQQQDTPEEASPELLAKLTKQTALAVQYRQRVQALEDQLEDFLQEKQEEAESNGRRRRLATTSPRTQKTLVETQRELRRARSQVREMGALREQVSSLKEQLKAAEKRAAKAEVGVSLQDAEPSRARDLRAQLREAKDESKRKDEEIQQLKNDFETFRKEGETRDEDTKAVLERAHGKIAELRKEVRNLKAAASEQQQAKNRVGQPGTAKYDGAGEVNEASAATVGARTRGSYERTTRRSSEKLGLRENHSSAEARDLDEKCRSLREKYREGTHHEPSAPEPSPTKSMSGALVGRPELEKPRWQPFVPRSPRNRGYLNGETSNRTQDDGITPAETRSKQIGADDLPTAAKSMSRMDRVGQDEPGDDKLRSRFVHLGGPNITTSHTNSNNAVVRHTPRSNLSPERRGAAMARIEQRRAEKLKERARKNGLDKENVRP
ncbi:hypothetical protein ACO1O0_008851 [Amphichorda felina]